MIALDIFADPVCPWCLIGKANLDRALESRPDHPFALAWQPFRLNPQFPAKGMAYGDYLGAKFGAEAGAVFARVEQAARAAGWDITPPALEPNTTDAHRLLIWAGLEGAQTRVMSGLLNAHWREGRDISDHSTLTAIAENAGMKGEMVRRLLESEADLDTLNAREHHARERGVRAVPTFILGNTHVISGAQPVTLWQNVIDELTTQPPA